MFCPPYVWWEGGTKMWNQVDRLHQNNEAQFKRKIIKCLADLKEQYLVSALCIWTAELSISCRTACGEQIELCALSLLWETLLSSTSCNSHKIVTGGCACLGWFCIKHWTGPQSIPGQHRDTGRIRTLVFWLFEVIFVVKVDGIMTSNSAIRCWSTT